MAGAYSGFPCEKVASYTPWITIEAQRKTLYDGLTVTQAPSVGPTTSMLCIMRLGREDFIGPSWPGWWRHTRRRWTWSLGRLGFKEKVYGRLGP